MINISTTTPVSWPTPPSAAVAPVAATPVVKPVQRGGPEAQAERETRRERPAVDEERGPAALPSSRPGASEPQSGTQARQDAAQRSEQASKKAEADKASHRKAMDRLQEVLTNMWAASAAVIDQALGLDPKGEALPGNQSDTAPDLSAVAASTMQRRLLPGTRAADVPGHPAADNMPWTGQSPSPEEATVEVAPEVPGGEVVAYDEHGNSSLAPLEVGTLLSEKA